MKPHITKLQKLDYMKKFSCIADRCPQTCCSGWTITIGKKNDRAYRSCTDSEIQKIANTSIRRLKNNRSSDRYSEIGLKTTDGSCAFLQDDKLCLIQARLGEEALSSTCSDYPRLELPLGEAKLQIGTLSCPEAARLSLLDDQAMFLDGQKISDICRQALNEPIDRISSIKFLYLSSLALMEDERFDLRTAVLIYGMALKKLMDEPKTSFKGGQRFEEFSSIISSVIALMSSNEVGTEQATETIKFQLNSIFPLLLRYTRNHIENIRFRDSVMQAVVGLGIDKNDLDLSAAAYNEAALSLGNYDKKIIQNAMSNYFVNDMLKQQILLQRNAKTATNAITATVTRLAVSNLIFIGMLAHSPESSVSDLLVKAVSVVGRTFDHTGTIHDELAEYINEIDSNSLAVLTLVTPIV